MSKLYTRGAIALLIAVPLGCDRAGPTELADLQPSSVINMDGTATVSEEEVDLCKVGPAGSSFDFTVTGPAHPYLVTNPTVASGSCVRVAFRGGPQYQVTITELAAAGFVLDSIKVDQLVSGVVTTTVTTGTNTASALAGGIPMSGAVVTFFNSMEPPQTGEGCTPGYWKQSQHFDSWPAPYTPGTLFGTVFDDAFPGMTLLQVASQGGGGLNALGRHTVAALLNAASGGVDYDLTVAQVIAGFNSAYASGDYETQKNIFEGYNELGCSLN